MMKQDKAINIISPLNQLGYGVAGLNIVLELNKLLEVSLWPIGQPEIDNVHVGLNCLILTHLVYGSGINMI